MKLMVDPFGLDVKKALVALVIQEALLEVSKVMFELVFERLGKDYNCYISDCYNHPEYLKDILKDFDDEFYELSNFVSLNFWIYFFSRGFLRPGEQRKY